MTPSDDPLTNPHLPPDLTTDALPAPGPFTDLAAHARGGLGEVYRGTDPLLHRTVAVKALQDRHAHNPDSRRRFLFEAEITARLEHPGVVPVYGLYPDGPRPAYAMRFVEGQTLAEAIASWHAGPPDPVGFRRLLQAFLQVCQTIAYAHARGVIHRDLKPANVMLGKFGETLVVDWGLAKVVGRSEEVRAAETGETLIPSDVDSEPGETAMGSAVGTPAYMSPEQAAGRWDVVHQASDVYSLGAVLYSLLTGRPPLEAGNWPEMQQKIQRGAFPRPRQVKPAVAPPLEAVCLKAMALDPEHRYPSAAALAAEVEHWLADEPVAAYPEGLVSRARRWAGRHRTLVSAGVVLLVTALAAAGIGLTLLGQKNQEIAAERNAAQRAADEAEAVNAFLTDDLLGQADPDRNPRGEKRVTVEEVLARTAKEIDANPKFADKPEVEATLRLTLGKTYHKLSNYPEAERHLRRAMQLRQTHLAANDPRTLAAQEAVADFLNLGRGAFAEAVPLALATWQARKEVLGPRHRDTLDSLDTYATALKGVGRYPEALDLLRECLAAREATLGPDHDDTLSAMNHLADCLSRVGEWEEANRLVRPLLAAYERKGISMRFFGTPHLLGFNLYYLGELAEAEAVLAKYGDRLEQYLGGDHVYNQHYRSILARVRVERGDPARAVPVLTDLIAARRKTGGAGDWRMASFLMDLGRAQLALGDPTAAATTLQEAKAMFARFPPRIEFYTPLTDAALGEALLKLGQRGRAEPLLRSADERFRALPTTPRRYRKQTAALLDALPKGP